MGDTAATSQLISVAEYLRFETPAGSKDELIEGEVFLSSCGSPNPALVIKRLVRLLDDLVESSGFEAHSDLSVIVDSADPASMPRPDAFVIDRRRFLEAAKRDAFPEGSPELAVVSPSNTKRELLAKLRLYLCSRLIGGLGRLSQEENGNYLGQRRDG